MNPEIFIVALGRTSFAAAVLVLLVLATQRIFRRQLSPRWHCALWLLVLLRLLPWSVPSPASVFNLLPAAAAPTPGVLRVPLGSPVAPPLAGTALPARAVVEAQPATVPPAARDFAWSWPAALFWSWLGGAVALAGVVAGVAFATWRRLARLAPLDDPAARVVLAECAARLGVRRGPEIHECDDVTTPVLHGLFRPRLLVPSGFTRRFSEAELRFVFLHELAHVKRGDLPLHWLFTTLQVVHWFNPLVWLGVARWRVDREIACDALALEAAGEAEARAYGGTMLRLLEQWVPRPLQPGFVGILESRRELKRRLRMIAGFTPRRRAGAAIALFAALAAIGLTDAQETAPAPRAAGAVPHSPVRLDGRFVIFLVQASDSMLGQNAAEVAQGKNASDEQKRAAPKWQRAVRVVEQMVAALPATTTHRIAIFNESVRLLPTSDLEALRSVVPGGGANLEAAFSLSFAPQEADRVVLVTDGLVTTSTTQPALGEPTDEQRIRFFELARRNLRPRVPVSTILLPMDSGPSSARPEDRGVTGFFWELATATRGELVAPSLAWLDAPRAHAAPAVPADRTHLAFVIDCSGSMRDPSTQGLWARALRQIDELLDAHPGLQGVQVLDASGRFALGGGPGGNVGWFAATPETRARIKRALSRYDEDTQSNPIPGLYQVFRRLYDPKHAEMKLGICVLGDEFNTADYAEDVLHRLDTLNPREANGHRRVTISAIGFPTTIRYSFSMGNTGLRYGGLMRSVAWQHGGAFVALDEL